MRYAAAGVPRGTAMALAGWQTEDIFERYYLHREAELVIGLEKVAAHRAKKTPSQAVAGRSGLERAQKARAEPG